MMRRRRAETFATVLLAGGLVLGAAAGAVPAAAQDHPLTTDFEAGLGPWQPRGDNTVVHSDAESRSGEHSALVTDRTEAWHGIGADVTEHFGEGLAYTVSAWVKLPEGSPEPADVRLSIQREVSGADTAYDTIATVDGVTDAEWVEVSATYTMAPADSALLYLETASGTADLLVDDIVVESPEQAIEPDIPSLQDELPWPIGVAIDERETTGAPAQLVTKHFGRLTAENHMKPEAIQPEEGVFTFAAADQLVDFAVANGMDVYGHTLVWHSQTPDWFFEDAEGNPLTDSAEHQELLRERMRTHIHTVADHFRERYGEYGSAGNPIVAFDVVNEAIAENEDDGLRRSPWYRVLGEEYLDLAFQYADEAFGDAVTLVLNDYNTELPAKRQAMVDVAGRLLERGAPLDALGHQFHVSLVQPVSQMRASIDAFAELGLPQVVTELDVQIDGTVTAERLVEQGYYFAQVFDMLREYPDLLAVTVWGPYDSRSWRDGAPLVFDDYLRAKPAYWGIVDPTQLPPLTRNLNVHAGDVPADETGLGALDWELLPLTDIASRDAGVTAFQARWSPDGLTLYVEVADATDDGADDRVEVFTAGAVASVTRDGSTSTSAATEPTDTGYAVVVDLPVEGLEEGAALPLDVRVTDGATGEQVSWNDRTHGQEDGERLGTATLVEPLAFTPVPRAAAEPVVDGEIEDVWADASVVTTDVQVEGEPGATAEVRLLWTPERVHLLFEVTDEALDDASSNAWEQDSVEVFLDPDNAKAGAFRPEDGQYRVSFANAVSISGDLAVIGENLTSATAQTDDGYVVELALELGREAQAGDLVGLEIQVNDATDGVRHSVRTWSDPTGRSYQDTSRWGVAQLVAADDGDGGDGDDTGDGTGDDGDGGGAADDTGGTDDTDDGAADDDADDTADDTGGGRGTLPTTGVSVTALVVLATAVLLLGAAATVRARAARR